MFAIVVDDSAAMRLHVSKVLQRLGWEVKGAGNGIEALKLLESTPACDLLLTDWHMPEMNGMDLCRAVRKETKYANVHILMVTSDAVMNSIDEALKAGANDFVMKPFTPDTLSERLADLVKR